MSTHRTVLKFEDRRHSAFTGLPFNAPNGCIYCSCGNGHAEGYGGEVILEHGKCQKCLDEQGNADLIKRQNEAFHWCLLGCLVVVILLAYVLL